MFSHALFIVALVTIPVAVLEGVEYVLYGAAPSSATGTGAATTSSTSALQRLKECCRVTKTDLVLYGVLHTVVALGLIYGSRSHPFIESDNRYIVVFYRFYCLCILKRLSGLVLYTRPSFLCHFSALRYLYFMLPVCLIRSIVFRHYIFYIWKRYLSSHAIRYAQTFYPDLIMFAVLLNAECMLPPLRRCLLAPVYSMGACLAVSRLRRAGRGGLWIAIYFVALLVTLVPTPLLEPRYFTPAVLFAILNGPEVFSSSSSFFFYFRRI
jgi:hypothetical protein